MSIRRRAAATLPALAALAVHAALVVWLTWPLGAHLTTHLPDVNPACEFDTLYMGWALAHESHTLATAPARLPDANIYHPTPDALFYGDTGFGALPYFLPTYLLSGNPTLALNLVLLSCFTLTAWTLHLVTVRWTGVHLAGFLAGWTFLTTRWVLWGVPSAPTYSVLQYLPLIVLLAATPARRFTSALALLPLVVLQSLTDVVYLATAVVAPLALLGLVRVARPATRRAGLYLLGVLAMSAALLVPVYAAHLSVRAANPTLAAQSLWATSGETLWLPRGLVSLRAPTAVPPAALLLIVIGGMSLLLGGRRAGARPAAGAWAHALFWAVVGFVISLPPAVYWQRHPVPLPQTLLARWVPVYAILRDPIRLGVGSLIGLSLLAGLAFAECARWLPEDGRLRVPRRLARLALAAVVAGLMYREFSLGYGVLGMGPIPRAYEIAAAVSPASPILDVLRRPGGPLLELPPDPRELRAPEFNARSMYRSIFHWRPLLNGYSSYWPEGFPERMALAARLPDPDALASLRRATGLELILVHLPADAAAAERGLWLPLAEGSGRDDLHLVARDGDDLLFSVADTSVRQP